MSNIGHEMIRASAGSGKTYALTNRFVRLLALGVAPERIVALTFTRKAAGEFLDAILQKLARCASSKDSATRLGAELALPAELSTPVHFRRLLRGVVDALHRLRLETLDAFFMKIAQSFALEIGLGAQIELLEAHAKEQAKAQVLAGLFSQSIGRLKASQHEFIEAFKEATYGQEAKTVAARLSEFIDENQDRFLEAPEAALPDFSEWPLGEYAALLAAARAALREAVDAREGDWDEKRKVWWARMFTELERWAPGAELKTPLKNILKALPDLTKVTMDRRRIAVEGPLRDALLAVARAIVAGELARHRAMTRGVYALLAAYEASYDAQVRRAGRLTFADVSRLLLPNPVTTLGRPLSADTDEWRLLLDYRLDAQTDHWMLDEFQDTSYDQWAILQNLIDEVLQDPEGRRSFFYVGDVKQSIYAWRGGDARLFGEVFSHYNNAQSGAIAERHLDESWRSGPPIIEMVNRVFGAASVLAELFPCELGPSRIGGAAEWNAQWREHRSARPELGGHAALLFSPEEAAGDGEGGGRGMGTDAEADKEARRAARFALTLQILRELPRASAAFSIAVLVQKNETAAELADYLRSEGGIEAVAEADLHVCADNPVGAALLACVQAAAHPGDRLAQAHVDAVPLLRDALPLDLAAPLFGLEPVIARLEEALRDDAFGRLRLRQWSLAAAQFEATGSRDPDEFIAYMRRYALREADSAGVVRVMTIHKSKGLGFDAVLLPDLEGNSLAKARDGLAVKRGPDRQIEWVLNLPKKEITECVPLLRDYRREAETEGVYEQLSKLYVAMTRAKRALYAIIDAPKPTSKSHNFPRLLTETLGANEPLNVPVGSLALRCAWAAGDFASVAPAEAEAVHTHATNAETAAASAAATSSATAAAPDWTQKIVEATAGEPRFPRLVARRPSDAERETVPAERLFAAQPKSEARRKLGSDVHRLFAQIEFAAPAAPSVAFPDGGTTRTAPADTAASPSAAEAQARLHAQSPEAQAIVDACLAAPSLAQVWTRGETGGRTEVWRERRFEAVIDGQWITGTFDRVVVEQDANGNPLRAHVYDFKTDEDTAGAAQRHAPQLALYRAAVAQLTGLPHQAVRSSLVLTKTQTLVEIADT